MRIRKLTRTLVSVAVLIGGGMLWTAPAESATPEREPAPAANPAATAPYQIGQFNMAGGHKKYGTLGNEAPDALIRSVRDRKPAFMTLNEACADWSDHLREQLKDEYDVVFDEVLARKDGPAATCGHPVDLPQDQRTRFGNGLLVRKDLGFDLGTYKGHPLGTSPEREQREMLCVTSPSRNLALCSAHLTHNSKTERRVESAEAKRILDTDYAGYTKFLGGDLNAEPLHQAPDNFYDTGYGRGARGQFKEVDSPCGNDIKVGVVVGGPPFPVFLWCRDGENTTGGRKIDFLYVPTSVHVNWADVTNAKHSDHRLLWAEVTF